MDALHEQLGLRPLAPFRRMWDNVPEGWHQLGIVDHVSDGVLWARIKVEVSYTPAVFWRFSIDSFVDDVQSVVLETGSGRLSDFWPTVLQFADGMVWANTKVAAMREP